MPLRRIVACGAQVGERPPAPCGWGMGGARCHRLPPPMSGVPADDGAGPPGAQLHILVLSDRDWTHPQGGGTGTNLYGQVLRWTAWGHRVSILACSYPGAAPCEQ